MTVVDCSAMVELLAAKTRAGESIAERLARSQILYAPYLVDGEVMSALLGLKRGGKITEQEADAAAASYRAFPIERQDVLPLWPRIKRLHLNLSAYDAQYVALAEVLGVPLVTADARIGRSGAARCDIEVFGTTAGSLLGEFGQEHRQPQPRIPVHRGRAIPELAGVDRREDLILRQSVL